MTVATVATVTPLVRCRDCVHFTPDSVNPAHGIGRCNLNAEGDRAPWPLAPRRCDSFEITRAALLESCRSACEGLDVDHGALAAWLTDQADPEWLLPAAVKRWAQLIVSEGWPE